MKFPSQYIFPFFASYMLSFASGYSSNSSINPVKEKTSMENIELSPFTPLVTLHPKSYDLSLLDSYLNSHKALIPLRGGYISWEVDIPAVAPIPNISSTQPSSYEWGLSTNLSKKMTTYPIESEVVKNVVFSKDFLLDVVSSLQKHKEYIEIHSIFHPENGISTELLERSLNNSLEFKVLSHRDIGYSKDTLAKRISDNNYSINLCNSTIQKQKELLTPNITLHNILLSPLKNGVLEKNSSSVQFIVKKQKTSDIKVPGLGLPSIITENSISYIYHPNMKLEGINIFSTFPSKWGVNGIKRYFSPIEDELYVSKLEDENLIFEEEVIKYAPKIASIDNDYLIIKPFKKGEKNSTPQVLSELKGVNNSPKNPLISANGHKIEKHLFIDTKFDLPYGGKLSPVDHIKITKANLYKNHPPNKENLFIEKEISLSLFLTQLDRKYHLPTEKMEPLSKIELISKASYSPYNGKSLEANRSLKGVNGLFGDYEIPLNNFLNTTYVEVKRFASNEVVEDKLNLNYPTLKPKDKTKHSIFKDSYPLTYDKRIAFKEGLIGKLEYRVIKNGEVLFSEDQLDYYSLLKPMEFDEKIQESNITKVKNFDLNKESFALNDRQLTNESIDTKISKIVSNSSHPFDVPIKKVSYTDSIKEAPASLSTIKDIIEIETSIDFSLKALAVIETNNLEKEASFESLQPLKTEKIHLEDQIKLDGVEFNGAISLPKLMAIDNKSSFFLNPMLLLINSNSYDIQEDITDTADKTNRANRMTQYSLFNWPTLEELQTDSLPEAFTLDTRLLSQNNTIAGEFACTIKSYEKSVLEPLPIHLLYILDTSKSIENHRFKIFKEAIIKSIDYLQPDAKFNIAILSKGKMEMLHKESLLSTTSSKGFVKRFLKKVEQSENVTFADISSLIEIEKKLASLATTHRMCLLLSDGKFASNIRIDREGLNHLSDIEAGNFSFYTASVSDNNNKPMLSFLAKLNHGFSLYTRTHASFSRKLCTLVTHLQHPIMHDITISFPDETNSKVYLSDHISPILLADKGFTFYGKNESATSSRIFIQGKAGDRWINILKELPISTARKGRYNLQKNLASQKTFLSLYSFLKTKDEKHIINAKEHQSVYDLTLPIP